MSSGVANTESLENGTDLTAVAGEAGGEIETFVEFFDESISVQNLFSDVVNSLVSFHTKELSGRDWQTGETPW